MRKAKNERSLCTFKALLQPIDIPLQAPSARSADAHRQYDRPYRLDERGQAF